jgi:flagellar biosynthesis protein FliQ
MDADYFLTVGREAMWVLALAATPILVPALLAGLVLGMVQAATSIQEQTLTFVPKLAATVLIITLLGHWMLSQLTAYSQQLIDHAATLVGS